MMQNVSFRKGQPYPLGLTKAGRTLRFSAAFTGQKTCGLCLLSDARVLLILPDESFRTGRIYSLVTDELPSDYYAYLFYEDGRFFADPYTRLADRIFTDDKAALSHLDFQILHAGEPAAPPSFSEEAFRKNLSAYLQSGGFVGRIEEDAITAQAHTELSLTPVSARPLTPLASSFYYCLNVRAYTMQDKAITDKAERGTLRALTKKIPYLKSLGVTGVELMPIFELKPALFNEELNDKPFSRDGKMERTKQPEDKPNLWGYADGYYFSVRQQLVADKSNPNAELLQTVEAFHANGLELILQFWFAESCSSNLILDCLRYYVTTFHIDGIHLKSNNIPREIILRDPLFYDIKVMDASIEKRPVGAKEDADLLFPVRYTEDFMWRARHFLKGDDNSLLPFAECDFTSRIASADIHYICNYDGFTLRDLVTYEHKLNDDNGEHSEDGRTENVSWNCGHEGETRKRQVLALRRKQMLNALSFVFLSQGIPLLHAGDESGNTQNGNNNPYCQDNRVGWTDTDDKGKYTQLQDYIRFLLALRKQTSAAPPHAMAGKELIKQSLPEISFHGEEAWKPDFSCHSHAFGILFSRAVETQIFVAMNMHWQDLHFALPDAPQSSKWFILSDTDRAEPVLTTPEELKGVQLLVRARSIVILKAVKTGAAPLKNRRDTVQKSLSRVNADR